MNHTTRNRIRVSLLSSTTLLTGLAGFACAAGSDAGAGTMAEPPAPMTSEPVDTQQADALAPVPTDAGEARKQALAAGEKVDMDLAFIDSSVPEGEEGHEVTLKQLAEKGPLVVVFYRGGWCPYCVGSLKAFEGARARIEDAGGTLIAVSGELPEFTSETKRKNKLGFPVLSDPGLVSSREFGIVWSNSDYARFLGKFNGNDRSELVLGVTYVIEPDGTISWAYLEDDYKKRADPVDVVEALQKIGS